MLVKCRECEKKISSESKTCIHCGYPTPYKKVKPYIHPSMKYGYFLEILFVEDIADFLGWLFAVAFLVVALKFSPEWLVNNYVLFYYFSAFCGCYYATYYLYYKKFWCKKAVITESRYSSTGQTVYRRIDNWFIHIFYLIGSFGFFFVLAIIILNWINSY